MAVPYVFGSTMGGSDIPLSELDDNFAYLTDSPIFTGDVTIDGSLGVGIISPTVKLNVLGSNNSTNFGVAGGSYGLRVDNGATFGLTGSIIHGVDDTLFASYEPLVLNGSQLGFAIEGIECARFDTSKNLLVGTTSATAKLTVIGTSGSPQAGFGTSANGIFVNVFDNNPIYFTSTTTNSTLFGIGTANNIPLTLLTNNIERARIDTNGNVICNTAAIATNATNGFLYVAGCAGTPTGVPTTYTGRVPIVVDTTNNRLYFYSGGSWRNAGP